MLTRDSIKSRLNEFPLSSGVVKLEQSRVFTRGTSIMQAAEGGSGSPIFIRAVAHHAEPCISPHISSNQTDGMGVALSHAKMAGTFAHLAQTRLPECSRTCIASTNDFSTN